MSAISTAPAERSPRHDEQIDWRFLLADDALGRVAVAGSIDPEVRTALEVYADEVVDLDGPAEGPFDLVVLSDPDTATVERAVAGLAPTGTIRIEQLVRRRRGPVRRLLTEAGLQVTTWWHRPSTAETRCLVALDRPIAAATVLRTVASRGRRTPVESRLARWTHVDRWADDVSYLAVRQARSIASPDGAPVAALVTPRFAASRAVIGVTTMTGGRYLGQVAKVARHPGDDALVVHEAELLARFGPNRSGLPIAPENHRLATVGGRTVLVEDAAQGEPLDRRAVRRDPDGALRAGLDWLDRVPEAPPTSVAEDGRGDALLLAALRRIDAWPWADPDEGTDLVGRTADALRPVLAATLPSPFEHGDFSHPNLFRQAGGELLAIDWELALPLGLPLHDLSFFLGYLAESVDRPRDPEGLAAAHRRALAPNGWADAAVTAHLVARGIDPSLRPALTLACWTRSVARQEPPAVPGDRRPHRYETLWRAALTDAERAGSGVGR
jgi:hypothetical protein